MYLDAPRDAISVRFDDQEDWVQVPVSKLTVFPSSPFQQQQLMGDAPKYQRGHEIVYKRTADPDSDIEAEWIRGVVLDIRRSALWICPLPQYCPQQHVAAGYPSTGPQGVWNEAIPIGDERLSHCAQSGEE